MNGPLGFIISANLNSMRDSSEAYYAVCDP
jgi:hypothetical protein